jgi:hypothetical protein
LDDAADRGQSRAPELEDLVSLCRALNAEAARYVLIGGFAVLIHGLVRTTKAVDLLVDSSDENVRAVKRALGTLPDNAAAEVADDDVRSYTVVRVADEIVVDLLGQACGIDYAAAVEAGIEHRDLMGVRIPLATKELLVRMKDTVRESDRADVRFLNLLIEKERRGER